MFQRGERQKAANNTGAGHTKKGLNNDGCKNEATKSKCDKQANIRFCTRAAEWAATTQEKQNKQEGPEERQPQENEGWPGWYDTIHDDDDGPPMEAMPNEWPDFWTTAQHVLEEGSHDPFIIQPEQSCSRTTDERGQDDTTMSIRRNEDDRDIGLGLIREHRKTTFGR